MDEAERRSRVAMLRRREARDNVDAWVASFLEGAAGARAELLPLSDEDIARWLSGFVKQYRLVVFLDYDGTLTPLTDHPSNAKLSDEMRRAIIACAERDDTDVAIISGRSLHDVSEMVGLPELTYAGNHGLEISGPEIPHFVHEDLVHYRERASELAQDLEQVAVDGAWIESKGPTLTFHYRSVPENRRLALAEDARSIINAAGYQARNAHCAVEARPPIGWDKGRAVLHVLRTRYGPSWSEDMRVIYVGDDQTDEDAFRFLAGLAVTFRVGSVDTSTAAAHRLPDVRAVQTLLEWLGNRKVEVR
jgi:trehalose 6-phosphate synthase/phosphatase